MNAKFWITLSLGFASLIAGTVMVFFVLDRHSHSVSDTLRPFSDHDAAVVDHHVGRS